MLGNILILRMTYRSELVSDGYTSITRGRNRTRNVTRYAKAFKDRGSLELTVLYARERNVPKGRKPLDWKLITNMPVRSRQQAIEKLEQARTKIRAELNKYNIHMTDSDLDTFVESAVKQMNDAWMNK